MKKPKESKPITLKNCPWCNFSAELQEVEIEGKMAFLPYCTYRACIAGLSPDVFSTKGMAEMVWNRRPNQWTSVKDGLPEESGEYLVTWVDPRNNRLEVEIGDYYKGSWRRFDEVDLTHYVTAWMPLPDAFEGEE